MHSFITWNCYMNETIMRTWGVKFNSQEIQYGMAYKNQCLLVSTDSNEKKWLSKVLFISKQMA